MHSVRPSRKIDVGLFLTFACVVAGNYPHPNLSYRVASAAYSLLPLALCLSSRRLFTARIHGLSFYLRHLSSDTCRFTYALFLSLSHAPAIVPFASIPHPYGHYCI